MRCFISSISWNAWFSFCWCSDTLLDRRTKTIEDRGREMERGRNKEGERDREEKGEGERERGRGRG